ncbi:MAG: isopenicillin N synthase family oxygenase [Ilumatobacteraceae bacterium]|nr:isopenicillin N synthase family oxygenase [Ilumatobacteraceae bacterium]MBP7887581.1 isopenicillin N synthase family oxygenase [Ilumatobacteraceae bacterium]MBP8208574.1 isopenicillin N synthase family oxygenase [Ilumatobacteraceae bacterium]
MKTLPIVDPSHADASARLDAACRSVGFFAVPLAASCRQLRDEVISLAAEFFALPSSEKELVSMARGGPAWRGWFPLGGELTSGVPDRKEGYYFGEELPPDPRPMHGPNLWPQHPAGLRDAVTEWMTAMTDLGQQLLRSMAQGLGLPAGFFEHNLTAAPTPLFRIFRYPPHPAGDVATWGVGEHTDYGLLTLLATDGTPGLQVHSYGEWIDAPADPDLVICNLGDMLDRLTGGRYRSNPHRVRNHAGADRYSLPFFMDPGWDAIVQPIEFPDQWRVPLDQQARWDKANLREISGTYGAWLSAKVAKVFPDLATDTGLPVR